MVIADDDTDYVSIVSLKERTIHELTPGLGFAVAWAPAATIALAQDLGNPDQAKCSD
jgi:hypothetical protein